MSAVNLIAVFAENQLGQMARITKVLADSGVNIRWVTIATNETLGVIKFLVDKCDLAYKSLHEKGWTVSLVEVLAIEVEDKPGGLYAVANCLARNQINVENSSGFVSNNRAVLLIEVQGVAKARQILAKQPLRLLSQEEILTL
ncbi:MAG TPA: ACT domain-containing protein [Verrucomicrobiae bacterium]|nr:ACT domain-containing protein [Verrucomicrobiae bacterium]